MKLSVSLSTEDVAVLDEYVRAADLPSRSAGVQRAVQLLRHPQIEEQYATAWAEWRDSGDASVWDAAAGDGVDDAPR